MTVVQVIRASILLILQVTPSVLVALTPPPTATNTNWSGDQATLNQSCVGSRNPFIQFIPSELVALPITSLYSNETAANT